MFVYDTIKYIVNNFELNKVFKDIKKIPAVVILGSFILFLIFVFYISWSANQANVRSASQATGVISNISTVEGTISFLEGDFLKMTQPVEVIYLTTNDSKKYELQFQGEKPPLAPGMIVSVRGVLQDNKILLDKTTAASFQVLQGPRSIASASPVTSTVKKIAVIMFNFQNNQAQPFTQDQVRQTIYTSATSTASYYREISYNKWNIQGATRPDGDIYGWYTVPYNNTNCLTNIGLWTNSAVQNAQANGYDSRNYDKVIYLFAHADNCFADGWAIQGDFETYLDGDMNIVNHELGHAFGLWHASAYTCKKDTQGRVPISNTCSNIEYGDPFDVMGGSYYTNNNYHINNVYKDLLGFLDPPNVQTITHSGTYSIGVAERPGSDVKLLRIPRGTPPPLYTQEFFYLEFRRPFGFDRFNPSDPAVNGLIVRVGPSKEALQYASAAVHLLDATAQTVSYLDAPLLPGQSLYDSDFRTFIRTISVSDTGATVDIQMPPRYQVSGLVNSVGSSRPAQCPQSTNIPINGAFVHITGSNYQTTAMTGPGGSGQNGAFYFPYVPNGTYDICPTDGGWDYNWYCTVQTGVPNRDPFKNYCDHITVNDSNVAGLRINMKSAPSPTPEPTYGFQGQ